ncbi:MAG TPA: ATP-binding protein [Treponemataceae bacterium]|nr:ATP-binding protein [Treponemataceae bacterium]HPX46884.1 ATP-binding protein [Treponemataceae bacterium]HQL32539.1 ATP-binding protein [Treponemataceae bacterium]
MREFIRRALQKTSRMNSEQLQSLLSLITEEYELLDAVLDSLGTGILICDSFHILVQHNKAAARILPFEFHDVQERPVWACVRESEIAAFIQQTIENEDSATAREFGVEEFSGTRFLSISVMPLVRSKSVRGTIITIEDVTWKKNEELRNRRLESLASLTNLAATVAHEIKNPLGSISIYVQLLRKSLARIPDGTPEELVQYLDIIDEEIERLNRIVVDFLFAVRPLKFEFTSLDLNLIIQSLAAFMSEELSHASVTLILDLAQSLPHIQGDDRFLRQMLINLIQNSLAAMPTGGTISIATSQTDDVITLTVSDTGTGIPADVIDRIFEPYFTTKADGTGLGLAMAYKVVKEHGGDIYVQSEVGKGTCFRITLPAVRKALKMIEYEEE